MLKAEKGVSKEDSVRPHLRRMEKRNQHGVYCIFTSMEMGRTLHSCMPQFPTDDPDYRIIRRVPSRFLHYYFYIRDPVIGRCHVRGHLHSWRPADPQALQAAADKIERSHHRETVELLELAAGSDVFGEGMHGRQPAPRLRHQSNRI